jgi:hypothetical protein
MPPMTTQPHPARTGRRWCLAAVTGVLFVGACDHHHHDDRDDREVRREQIRVVDDRGFRHEGYYDDRHDWHGGYYDEGRVFHDDPHEWRHDRYERR